MSFPRYPKYKPSGVEWLGDVPEHWEVRRLKSLVEEPLKYGANESAELDDRTLPRFVRITDIDDDGGLRDETFKSLPRDVGKLVDDCKAQHIADLTDAAVMPAIGAMKVDDASLQTLTHYIRGIKRFPDG